VSEVPVTIERSVIIEAEPETVFGFLIDPRFMAESFGISHVLEAKAGGTAGFTNSADCSHEIRPRRLPTHICATPSSLRANDCVWSLWLAPFLATLPFLQTWDCHLIEASMHLLRRTKYLIVVSSDLCPIQC
jgi:hypothetical protein